MKSVVSLPAMMSAAAAPPLANFTATTASRPTAPSIQCNLLFYVRHHVYSHKKYSKNGITIKYRDLLKHIRPEKGYSSTSVRGTIYCSNQKERNVGLPSDHIAVGAKVIYAAAPAMGHNQVK
uniref:Histone deacetylase n=2 Tax=Solanum TaxID=4107 RepID=M1A3R5_SOLTU